MLKFKFHGVKQLPHNFYIYTALDIYIQMKYIQMKTISFDQIYNMYLMQKITVLCIRTHF